MLSWLTEIVMVMTFPGSTYTYAVARWEWVLGGLSWILSWVGFIFYFCGSLLQLVNKFVSSS
jgi:hypothetical protein